MSKSLLPPHNHCEFRISPDVAQFLYRGYEISMSTMFSPCVAVFGLDSARVLYDARDVEDAVRWVDADIKACK